MIRINLVNKSTVQIQPGASVSEFGEVILGREELQKQAGLRIFVMLIFPAVLYIYEQNFLIPSLNQNLNAKRKELADLRAYNEKREPSVNEIKKYEDEKEKIQKKISLLNEIANERSRELALHRFFQKIVPEKTWFNEYNYDQTNNRITIHGNSFFASDIPKLRSEIQGNVMFKSVEIGSQKEVKFQGQSVEEFEININLEKNSEPTP